MMGGTRGTGSGSVRGIGGGPSDHFDRPFGSPQLALRSGPQATQTGIGAAGARRLRPSGRDGAGAFTAAPDPVSARAPRLDRDRQGGGDSESALDHRVRAASR